MGGYARHAAATMAGIEEAPAVIHSGTCRDALALAWKENADDAHRPRSREDLLDVVASIRTLFPGVSVRDVERLAGIPKSSAHRLLGAAPPAPAASWTREPAGILSEPIKFEPEVTLETPFPLFGSKARLADLVWSRFGNVNRYVEGFAGTLAALLKRPDSHFDAGTARLHETIVDANHFILNFWRATSHEPEAVAKWADNPIAEADIQARHRWLTESTAAVQFRDRIASDPDYFDPKFAGWWVWGQNLWLAGMWCVRDGHKTLANWKHG